MKTVLFVRTGSKSIFDGSVNGTSLKLNGDIAATKTENQFQITKGFIEAGILPGLDGNGVFTLEATVAPTAVLGGRQNIIESQTPPVALFIDDKGFLVGSVNVSTGWKSITSNMILTAGKSYHVRFSRDANGNLNLEIDDKNVGTLALPGVLQPVGTLGFRIGTGMDGNAYQYRGIIGDVQIRNCVFTSAEWNKRLTNANNLQEKIKAKLGINIPVQVFPGLDESNIRLQVIKDIMNAAGVEKISDLDTLRISVPTKISKGKVLVANKKSDTSKINWKSVAVNFKNSTIAEKQTQLAKYLPNRNSLKILKTAKLDTVLTGAATTGSTAGSTISHSTGSTIGSTISHTAGSTIGSTLNHTNFGGTTATGTLTSETLTKAVKLYSNNTKLSDLLDINKIDLTVKDKDLLVSNLESKTPSLWLGLSQVPQTFTLKTLPLNTSVIIAGNLDLTDTQVIIEPDVEKLYIIAENVICGPNAKITWRKPGGFTPARLFNPDLNGRGWSGVQTKPNSFDGLDGEDGRAGESGINGARGLNAPGLEMWVKNLTNVPSIDLSGENGIIGGRGQNGGKGGNGADGHLGEVTDILVTSWCSKDPGDGGNGGDGGHGGNGGRGGNGGNGGNITIGVLDGTLAATVTAGQFQWKNQGGQIGRGASGGSGGFGGRGGRSGAGEKCHDAKNGNSGAQGQPGSIGADGNSNGSDANDSFFEFSEDDWNELLTRPFITEINPNDVFPGNVITIKGSLFVANDRVIINGSASLIPVVNADESISVTIPLNISGGTKSVYVQRASDNTESNRIPIRVKPQLDNLPSSLAPDTDVTITGKAFLANASALIDGNAIPGNVNPNGTQITFTMVGTGGTGSSGGSVTVAVRNPDGLVSNTRTATKPQILEIPFTFGENDLPFPNFSDGIPSWDTYEETFGADEVWHELLDPIFGHPILTAAYYEFYNYFLKGQANGGLATGFCTSLASFVADKLWKGENDTHTITKDSIHKLLTAVHGKLLSRESLLHFHDQGRQAIARVELTARQIERTFLTGCDRNVAPLLFFIPSGEVWDSGYFDKLSDSHCIMPYRFVYPDGHPGPQLSADRSTTISSLDGVQLFCWDCNNPGSNNCRLEFRMESGVLNYSYFPGGAMEFDSTQGITLGFWTNGDYNLADHDLPFSGPFGLTSFIIDFLLSPADLEITDENGLRAGNFNNKIYSEMPDSHPCYLIKGAYLLPVGKSFTRDIVGNGNGNYTFNSIMPDGTTIKLENVATQPGHRDTLLVNSDASQIRFAPQIEKDFTITFSKLVDNQVRSLALSGVGGGPGTEMDVTVAPDLSLFRLGNRSSAKNVTVKAFSVDKANAIPVNKNAAVALPNNNDLVVTVSDWKTIDMNVETLAF